MQYGALKVAQDRSPDSHHRTQNLGVAVDGLSLPGAIPTGAPAVASRSSALLKGREQRDEWGSTPSRAVVCLTLTKNRNTRGADGEPAAGKGPYDDCWILSCLCRRIELVLPAPRPLWWTFGLRAR